MQAFVTKEELNPSNRAALSSEVYGLTSSLIARKSVSPIVVTGGNGAWGTEILIHDGATIQSGDATKKFAIDDISVVAAGTANRPTVLEFYSASLGAAKTAVAITDLTDLFTKVGHGLVDGDQVILSSIVTTTGLSTLTAYYVIGVAGDDFQLSLTVGGAAVAVGGGDGTCSVQKITKTLMAETISSEAATTSTASQKQVRSDAVACNKLLLCRGWASGGTNAVSFFMGIRTFAG